MTNSELITRAKKYFGKDKTALKELILGFDFNGKEYQKWKKWLSQYVDKQPFDVSFNMMDAAVELIVSKKYDALDSNFLGDLSWEIEILLNENVIKGYDWDKMLCSKCNGTARILRIYVSDIIPAFTYETYSMTYSKAGNYYEFQAISDLSDREMTIVSRTIKALRNDRQLFFVSKTLSAKRFKDLYSDCNADGNATIFDVLFSDVHNFQSDTIRFNDKNIKNKMGREVAWREFYDDKGILLKRVEHQFFESKNILKIETNGKDEILNVSVWKDTEKKSHQEFKLKLPPQYDDIKH